MTTDFRTLCAELLRGLDENRHPEVRYPGHLRLVMAAARAALAQPAPKRPTVMEIIELSQEIEDSGLGQIDLVRAALARWGHPTAPPTHPMISETQTSYLALDLESLASLYDSIYDEMDLTPPERLRAATVAEACQRFLSARAAKVPNDLR